MPKPLTTDPATSGPAPAGAGPEVEAKPRRRFFSAAEKLAILAEADTCQRGELGALLRREGLYSSLITDWRRLRAAGQLSGLTPQKRGPKIDPHAAESARQQQTISRLEKRLQQAEAIIEAQKKLSELFGLSQPTPNSDKP